LIFLFSGFVSASARRFFSVSGPRAIARCHHLSSSYSFLLASVRPLKDFPCPLGVTVLQLLPDFSLLCFVLGSTSWGAGSRVGPHALLPPSIFSGAAEETRRSCWALCPPPGVRPGSNSCFATAGLFCGKPALKLWTHVEI
jgi:hypothetical protein